LSTDFTGENNRIKCLYCGYCILHEISVRKRIILKKLKILEKSPSSVAVPDVFGVQIQIQIQVLQAKIARKKSLKNVNVRTF
jgi:hypothetical protein